ncbi:MAG: transcriptional regulator [Desulfobacteraceae bacterium]|nr:MAG: transcriptional regulator [Desulfobacteraceae bacterium]
MAIGSLKPILGKGWTGFKRLVGLGPEDPDAKSFKAYQQKEEAFDTRHLGLHRIPLDKIVGSVGRYQDFDGQFRPKQHFIDDERLVTLKGLMRQGKKLPPIKLYQIKDDYYVLDGNHRVAVAKELGRREIDAQIVEFIPSKNTMENIIYREKAEFMERTGLPNTIVFTEPGQYAYLGKQIARHRRFLNRVQSKDVPFREAAGDWYKTIYNPFITIIKKGHLLGSFSGRTEADLYAYISLHQWEKGWAERYGSGIEQVISRNMEEFRRKIGATREFDYPEMEREIIAFILMNVVARKERKIIEKLAGLEEVREVHAVHGTVDVLVKVVLKRDLLSSDAEVIGNFVQNHMRQLPGVLGTQTLIPSHSNVKEKREVH